MPYNPMLVAPMREEMTRMGARELTTPAEVDEALGDQRGTTLVFVNSVCGCAAGNARPALAHALRCELAAPLLVGPEARMIFDRGPRARHDLGIARLEIEWIDARLLDIPWRFDEQLDAILLGVAKVDRPCDPVVGGVHLGNAGLDRKSVV